MVNIMTLTRCTLALFIVSCGACASLARAETVLITGANSGIGLEFAKEYATKGWSVIATHRRAEIPKSLAELARQFPKVRIEELDVTNIEQTRSLAGKLEHVPVDVLINNAGVYNDRGGCAAEDESCPGEEYAALRQSALPAV
jgi:NADP-dependent 3-hydroxy acid dehydrogenase YdfG